MKTFVIISILVLIAIIVMLIVLAYVIITTAPKDLLEEQEENLLEYDRDQKA